MTTQAFNAQFTMGAGAFEPDYTGGVVRRFLPPTKLYHLTNPMQVCGSCYLVEVSSSYEI